MPPAGAQRGVASREVGPVEVAVVVGGGPERHLAVLVAQRGRELVLEAPGLPRSGPGRPGRGRPRWQGRLDDELVVPVQPLEGHAQHPGGPGGEGSGQLGEPAVGVPGRPHPRGQCVPVEGPAPAQQHGGLGSHGVGPGVGRRTQLEGEGGQVRRTQVGEAPPPEQPQPVGPRLRSQPAVAADQAPHPFGLDQRLEGHGRRVVVDPAPPTRRRWGHGGRVPGPEARQRRLPALDGDGDGGAGVVARQLAQLPLPVQQPQRIGDGGGERVGQVGRLVERLQPAPGGDGRGHDQSFPNTGLVVGANRLASSSRSTEGTLSSGSRGR